MTDLLCLEKKLDSDECTKLILFIANSSWKCELIHYLVVKSDLPGSGVAATLSCDLSGFPWKYLLQKQGVNVEVVQAIAALKGIITPQDISNIIRHVNGKDCAILHFSISHCTPKLDNFGLIKLYEVAMRGGKSKFADEVLSYLTSMGDPGQLIKQAMSLKSYSFVEKLISQGEKFDPTLVVSKLQWSDMQTKTSLISCIMSTPQGRLQLFLKAVGFHEFGLAEDCLVEPMDAAMKSRINLSSILKFPMNEVTRYRRQQFVSFVKKLLDLGINSNGESSATHPLDIVLNLSNDFHSEKVDLLVLLLEYGAAIDQCLYEKAKGTTLIHVATKFAIDSGRFFSLLYYFYLFIAF